MKSCGEPQRSIGALQPKRQSARADALADCRLRITFSLDLRLAGRREDRDDISHRVREGDLMKVVATVEGIARSSSVRVAIDDRPEDTEL